MADPTRLKQYVDRFCVENGINLQFSTNMPTGYETANGTYDVASNTLCFNADLLLSHPDYAQLFFLFHELRHALQYNRPELFDEAIQRSRLYSIMYDGSCYALSGNTWKECRLEGPEEYFVNAYLGQPHEMDANIYAHNKVKHLCGDSEGLHKLFSFWMPQNPLSDEEYRKVYHEIDQLISLQGNS